MQILEYNETIKSNMNIPQQTQAVIDRLKYSISDVVITLLLNWEQ